MAKRADKKEAVEAILALVPQVFLERPTRVSGFLRFIGRQTKEDSRRDEAAEAQPSAAQALHELLERLGAPELLALDNEIRYGSRAGLEAWTRFDAKRLHSTPAGELAPAAIALLTMHRNGHVREGAVRRLAAEAPDFGFPFILLRANDWVAQVRAAANQLIAPMLVPSRAQTVAKALPLIERFELFGRTRHNELREALRACLESPEGLSMLLETWARHEPEARRMVIRFLSGSAPATRALYVDRASRDADPMLRLWAARQLESLESSDPAAADELLARMHADSSSAVRLQAIYGLVRRGTERAIPQLTDRLFDSAASVRYAARFYLAEAGVTSSFAELYRAQLTGRPSRIVAAIAGLAETGTAEDAQLLTPLLDHPVAKVVVAALAAQQRLDADATRARRLEALIDPRATVAKRALQLLERRLPATDTGVLCDLGRRVSTKEGARSLTLASARLPLWLDLVLLLELAALPNELIAGSAASALAQWYPRGRPDYETPGPNSSARNAIHAKLTVARRTLPVSIATHLSRVIKAFM